MTTKETSKEEEEDGKKSSSARKMQGKTLGGKERNEALEYTCLNRYEEEERELGEEEYEFTRHNTHEGLDSYITLAN